MTGKKNRAIVATLLFAVAFMLPLFAIWRYSRAGMAPTTSRVPSWLFYIFLLTSLIIFFIQWKIDADVWLRVRAWFAKHIWSFALGMMVILMAQSLLFFRQYVLQSRRWEHLGKALGTIDDDVDRVFRVSFDLIDPNVEETKNSVNEIKKRVNEIEKRLSNIERLLYRPGQY